AVRAQAGLFGFHEVADVDALPQLGARAQARERADATGFSHLRTLDVAMPHDLSAGRQLRVADPGERTDADAIAEYHVTFQDHVHIDLHIAPHADLSTNVDPRRIRQTHAGQAQC